MKSAETGNVIGRVQQLAGKPPRNVLDVQPPAWLRDPEAHARACAEEARVYQRIAALLSELSGAREEQKARHLVGLLQRHRRVLAFDWHLITLSEFRRRLLQLGVRKVLLGTGATSRHEIEAALDLESQEDGVVTLCSDALSEGVNLQGASAVVHLDMPSVVRVMEQRIGRVDRMDSPFPEIEAWWPDDTRSFALRSDERAVARHEHGVTLLGANLQLPKIYARKHAAISAEAIVREFEVGTEGAERAWDELTNAFEPVRRLIAGPSALVPQDLYEEIRPSKARIQAAVSAVRTTGEPWVFLVLAAADQGPPRWLFVPGPRAEVVTDLEQVNTALRERLTPEPVDVKFNEAAVAQLGVALERLAGVEETLLSGKKRRALLEMRWVVGRYRDAAKRVGDRPRHHAATEILDAVRLSNRENRADLNAAAEWWLAQVRSTWLEHLLRPRRTRPALLKEIRQALLDAPLATSDLAGFSSAVPTATPMHKRVVVTIVGLATEWQTGGLVGRATPGHPCWRAPPPRCLSAATQLAYSQPRHRPPGWR